MRRRDLLTLLGGAAGAPFGASAQQKRMPVVGFLTGASNTPNTASLHQGLSETGYVVGRNVVARIRTAPAVMPTNDSAPGRLANVTSARIRTGK